MARIAELRCHPVKGCAGVSLTETELTAAGPAHDRSFMVVGEDGVFRSQRRDPLLAAVRPDISEDGTRLSLSAPGLDELHLEVTTTAARQRVELFGTPYQGIDQGQQAADWLSAALGVPSRLVRVPPDHRRTVDGVFPGTAGYADSGAVHALSLASVDALNERLAHTADGLRLEAAHFRPNLVIEGWETPHQEDGPRRIGVGDTELGHLKLAVRCAVVQVDQRTGRRSGPEPLRTLAGYRRAPEGGGVVFGVKWSVLRTGKVAVGDEVTVIEPG